MKHNLICQVMLYLSMDFFDVNTLRAKRTNLHVPAGSADLPIALPEGVCYHSRQIEIFQVIYHERLGLRQGGWHQNRGVDSGKPSCRSNHLIHP